MKIIDLNLVLFEGLCRINSNKRSFSCHNLTVQNLIKTIDKTIDLDQAQLGTLLNKLISQTAKINSETNFNQKNENISTNSTETETSEIMFKTLKVKIQDLKKKLNDKELLANKYYEQIFYIYTCFKVA